MRVYLDSSALAKSFFEDEAGRDEFDDLLATGPDSVTTRIAYVECHAALVRAVRDGRIDDRQRRTLERTFQGLWDSIHVVELDHGLAESAAAMTKRHSIRAGDAIHLAAALSIRTAAEMRFACWDQRLRNAALAEGFHLLPEHA